MQNVEGGWCEFMKYLWVIEVSGLYVLHQLLETPGLRQLFAKCHPSHNIIDALLKY